MEVDRDLVKEFTEQFYQFEDLIRELIIKFGECIVDSIRIEERHILDKYFTRELVVIYKENGNVFLKRFTFPGINLDLVPTIKERWYELFDNLLNLAKEKAERILKHIIKENYPNAEIIDVVEEKAGRYYKIKIIYKPSKKEPETSISFKYFKHEYDASPGSMYFIFEYEKPPRNMRL